MTGVQTCALPILNGVTGGPALAIDGIACSIQGDRQRAPAAMLTVLLRIDDLEQPNAEPSSERLSELQARVTTLFQGGEVSALSGPEITAHVGHGAGLNPEDVAADRILRAPADRGMTATRREAAPHLHAAVARWQTRIKALS